MLNTIIGTKDEMSQTFVDDTRVPVTIVQAGPCMVTQIKTLENDGYWAIQVGLGNKKTRLTSKQLQGHLSKPQNSKVKTQTYPRHLREIRTNEEPEVKVGDTITVADIFAPGDTIKVSGTSKGKGFAGGVKRWGFRGGSKTHGQSDRHRAPGSIGQGTDPGRVHKGKKMAGRMGTDTVTISNLKIVNVDVENNRLYISGPIPGSKGTVITIERTSPKQEIAQSEPEVSTEETQSENQE